MGSQINTNAKKANLESVMFWTFDFEKIMNNAVKIQMKISLAPLIFKIHNILLPKSPRGT